jgi:hypothetical protein
MRFRVLIPGLLTALATSVPTALADSTTTTVKKTTVMTDQAISPDPLQTSSSSYSETDGFGLPRYSKRVAMLIDQVNDAQSKCWITAVEASDYRDRLGVLALRAENASNSTAEMRTMLEQEINAFNVELSTRLAIKH